MTIFFVQNHRKGSRYGMETSYIMFIYIYKHDISKIKSVSDDIWTLSGGFHFSSINLRGLKADDPPNPNLTTLENLWKGAREPGLGAFFFPW